MPWERNGRFVGSMSQPTISAASCLFTCGMQLSLRVPFSMVACVFLVVLNLGTHPSAPHTRQLRIWPSVQCGAQSTRFRCLES